MLRVGLTGNVAAGKSTVLDLWAAEGVPVVSADELSRRAVEPGSPGLAEVRATFGESVILPDGTLDRAALRELVFRDEGRREQLEAVLHPRVRALRDAWLAERAAEGARLVVAEIPLLFETGMEGDFDRIVLVDAPGPVRLARMVAGRGLDEGEARRIMAAQMDPAEKRRRAHHVLDNSGTLELLRGRALALLADLRAQAGPLGEDPAGGVIRLDLHLHTWASWDCLSDPERVLEAARRRGVERLAVTDHNRLDLALRLAERFPDRIIPGEEVRTSEGIDVIGHYIHEEIPKGTPAREVAERVREQGGVVYLPHPYARGKGGSGRLAEELAPLVDVVEVFNARLHPASLNEPAEELARRHGLLRGAGSDAHTVSEVAGASVEVTAHANEPAAFLKALAGARVHGRTAGRGVHLASTWAKVRKRLPRAPGADETGPPGG